MDDALVVGVLERARAVLEAVASVRAAVGAGFPVAVKLNSADFQKGGFAFEDSLQVAAWLEEAGVDVTLEILPNQEHVLFLSPVELMNWIDQALGL